MKHHNGFQLKWCLPSGCQLNTFHCVMKVCTRKQKRQNPTTSKTRQVSGILFSLKQEILTYAKTQMNLEGIMLSEVNQSQREKYHILSLLRESQSSQIHRESRINRKSQTSIRIQQQHEATGSNFGLQNIPPQNSRICILIKCPLNLYQDRPYLGP